MEQDFMCEAVAAAQAGVTRQDGGPFGAVIVRNGQIISRACNRVIREQDPTAHAEVNAIREACRVLGRIHLEDCDLYTSCEPCPMCLGAIYWARLRSVYFAATRNDAAAVGFSDAAIYGELALPPEARAVSFVKTDAAAARAVMRAWQADTGKHTY
jgi:tRNA(Arg) A34 adenosine deaminase TadA